MNNMEALGYFMDYCNRNLGIDPNVTNDMYKEGINDITCSYEGRFEDCVTVEDVLFELGY